VRRERWREEGRNNALRTHLRNECVKMEMENRFPFLSGKQLCELCTVHPRNITLHANVPLID